MRERHSVGENGGEWATERWKQRAHLYVLQSLRLNIKYSLLHKYSILLYIRIIYIENTRNARCVLYGKCRDTKHCDFTILRIVMPTHSLPQTATHPTHISQYAFIPMYIIPNTQVSSIKQHNRASTTNTHSIKESQRVALIYIPRDRSVERWRAAINAANIYAKKMEARDKC